MQALVNEGIGALAIREVPTPSPGVGEELVRTKYVGICGSDLHVWLDGLAGVVPPKIMGHELVGQIASGPRAGTRVVVEPLIVCGSCRACRDGYAHVCRNLKVMGVHADGGAAEYLVAPATRLHPFPDSLSWEAAALAEPTAVAVHMLRQVGLDLGDTVLVLGGGPIGFLVASVARATGAGRVLLSEVSPQRIDFCRSAGLEVIDAGREDPVEIIRALTDGEGADVVVEAAGSQPTAQAMLEAARVRGKIMQGGLYSAPPTLDLRLLTQRELQLIGARVYEPRDVAQAIQLLADGRVDVSGLVTRIVPLANAVKDGFEPLRTSRSEMKILLEPGGVP
jgi:2-desacetyl-2-hydroxyethyl bacteriochlorophyllide A dehydrogenase